MNCERFHAWLDDGRPEASAAGAHDHSASCTRCAVALRAASDIEVLLAAPARSAPAGFADRVMARVAAAEASASAGAGPLPASARRAAAWARQAAASGSQPLAWWVDAAAQPASVLAFGVASLSFWQREALWRFATDLAAGRWRIPALPLREAVQAWDVMTGVAIAVLPLAVLAAWALYLAAERWVGPPHAHRAMR